VNIPGAHVVNISVPREIEAELSPRTKVERFDPITILIHWVTVVLMIALFTTAWSVNHTKGGPGTESLLRIHRSIGVTIWVLTAFRLAWRTLVRPPPPFPENMSLLQRRAAQANELGLYALLLLQPVLGLAQSLLSAHRFGLFVWDVSTIEGSPALWGFAHQAHELTALALLALIGAHALAALYHALVRRDGVIRRMLP
jgi:superoxide oxidase